MAATDVVVLLIAVLFVLAPLMLYVRTGYEGPVSVGEALWRRGLGLALAGAIIAAYNFIRFGIDFAGWYWVPLIGFSIGISIALFVDWLILLRRDKRNAI